MPFETPYAMALPPAIHAVATTGVAAPHVTTITSVPIPILHNYLVFILFSYTDLLNSLT